MSKELADRMEKVASDLLRDGMLDNAESKIIDEAIAALRKTEPVAWTASLDEVRDNILNGRGPLESVLNNDQTNAVLSVFDELYAAPAREDQRSEAAVTTAESREISKQSLLAPEQQSSDHPSRTDRQEPELSAEQIEAWRRRWLRMYRTDVKEDAENIRQINKLCDMARRSRTAPINTPNGDRQELIDKCLDAGRDEGIEAAAKLIRKRLDGIYEDHSYTEQDTGAVVIDNAEIEGRANELEELEEEIRALAQGQWSKSTVSTSHVTGETQQDAEPADHPTEQDADELLREALDAYDHIVVKTGYQGDFDTSAGRAHLARKEPK